jgi:hypothetical protein
MENATKRTAAGDMTSGKEDEVLAQGSSQDREDSRAGKEMVLVGDRRVDGDADEEEFDFDPAADVVEKAPNWFAMARFYSCIQNPKGLFDEMGAAWRLERPITVRKLGDNRFILEFDIEHHYQYALNGGPWLHKGDALIVVSYDGVSRPSEVVIDSINMWV